jgi:hypothetical protein
MNRASAKVSHWDFTKTTKKIERGRERIRRREKYETMR